MTRKRQRTPHFIRGLGDGSVRENKSNGINTPNNDDLFPPPYKNRYIRTRNNNNDNNNKGSDINTKNKNVDEKDRLRLVDQPQIDKWNDVFLTSDAENNEDMRGTSIAALGSSSNNGLMIGVNNNNNNNMSGNGRVTKTGSSSSSFEASTTFILLGVIILLSALFLHLVSESSPGEQHQKNYKRRTSHNSALGGSNTNSNNSRRKKKTDEWSEDELDLLSDGCAYRADSEGPAGPSTSSRHPQQQPTLYYPYHQPRYPQQQHRHRKVGGSGGGQNTAATPHKDATPHKQDNISVSPKQPQHHHHHHHLHPQVGGSSYYLNHHEGGTSVVLPSTVYKSPSPHIMKHHATTTKSTTTGRSSESSSSAAALPAQVSPSPGGQQKQQQVTAAAATPKPYGRYHPPQFAIPKNESSRAQQQQQQYNKSQQLSVVSSFSSIDTNEPNLSSELEGGLDEEFGSPKGRKSQQHRLSSGSNTGVVGATTPRPYNMAADQGSNNSNDVIRRASHHSVLLSPGTDDVEAETPRIGHLRPAIQLPAAGVSSTSGAGSPLKVLLNEPLNMSQHHQQQQQLGATTAAAFGKQQQYHRYHAIQQQHQQQQQYHQHQQHHHQQQQLVAQRQQRQSQQQQQEQPKPMIIPFIPSSGNDSHHLHSMEHNMETLAKQPAPIPFIPRLDNSSMGQAAEQGANAMLGAAPPSKPGAGATGSDSNISEKPESILVEELQLVQMESGARWRTKMEEQRGTTTAASGSQQDKHQYGSSVASATTTPSELATTAGTGADGSTDNNNNNTTTTTSASSSSSSSNPNDPRKSIIHKRKDLTAATDSASSLQSSIDFKELKLQEVIGGGGFGQVWRATWQGTPVAVKVLTGSAQSKHVSKAILEEFAAEINLLKGMRHPNICLYMGASVDPPNRAIITELAANGSLWDALRLPLTPPFVCSDGISRNTTWPSELYSPGPHGAPPIPNPPGIHHHHHQLLLSASPPIPPRGAWPWVLVKRVACGAARGMAYLHSGKPPILHRDLKSANILLDESYTAKVCDFGLSRLKAQERSMTGNCGTVQWMAPEVLANQSYNEKADVFSFGIICWELLSRECPYEGMNAIQCALAVLNHDHRPEIPKWCPQSLRALIMACVKKDMKERPTFRQIILALDAFP